MDTKKILKNLEGAFKFMPILSLKEFKKDIVPEIDKIQSLKIRSNIYLSLARHYKNIAQNNQFSQEASELGKYFLKKSAENGVQYENQTEMLPDFFNSDMPV